MGGQIWDEQLDHMGVVQQLDVVTRLLSGDVTASFTQVQDDFAFYGIVAVFPAYMAEAGVRGPWASPIRAPAFSLGLHAVSFLCNLLTLLASYLLLLRATASRGAAMAGAGLLALYPLWLGFSFFDYKDIPTACFVTLALYAAVGLLQSEDMPRRCAASRPCWPWRRSCSTGLKIPAIVLVVPSWVAAASWSSAAAALGLRWRLLRPQRPEPRW